MKQQSAATHLSNSTGEPQLGILQVSSIHSESNHTQLQLNSTHPGDTIVLQFD